MLFLSKKIKENNSCKNKGFTLIELIVSIGLFSVVSTLAIGSIIVLVDNNRALRSEQSTITNVSFALDAMTRDIRMGYNYFCQVGLNFNPSQENEILPCPDGLQGSPSGIGISFVEGDVAVDNPERRAYFYDGTTILRRNGSDPAESIISSSIEVVDFDMFVSGTDRGINGEQPVVTIYMRVESESGQQYDFQTSVTQRFLNI